MSDKNNTPPERRAWRTNDEWDRLNERITASSRAASVSQRMSWRTRSIAAAAAVLVFGAGMSWWILGRRTPVTATPVEQVATTGVGERRTIRLADSSIITLGPLSTIRYSLSTTDRTVTLDGVADFIVTHDAARPFRVRAKNAVVTDIGTEFVIRAYASDTAVNVAVTSGVVAISGAATDSVELQAGQVGVVAGDGRAALVAGASTRTLAAWVNGQLAFDNVPLSEVATELGRWFDVEIRIPNEQLRKRRMSAVYSQATLSGVLNAISATLPVQFQRAGNVVTILPANR